MFGPNYYSDVTSGYRWEDHDYVCVRGRGPELGPGFRRIRYADGRVRGRDVELAKALLMGMSR